MAESEQELKWATYIGVDARKRYLTPAEQSRTLMEVLEQALREAWMQQGAMNPLDLERLPHIAANVRAGFLFCRDVPQLARLFWHYRIE